MKSSKRGPDRGAERTIPEAIFFEHAEAFRDWLTRHHATRTELWVGFHRKASGRTGLDYDVAVEAALCFGWIDGIRKKLDLTRYTNRFTPRKPGSPWSRINLARVERLKAAGLMHEAGLRAWERRDEARTGPYSYDQRPSAFPAELETVFRRQRRAWRHFESQPPGYRRLAIWWVVSAKRDDTRQRRLAQLIEASAANLRLGAFLGQTGSAASPARRPAPKKAASAPARPRTGTRSPRSRR